MRLPCGWEGPRGGACNRGGVYKVSAGDAASGPCASSFACERHLHDVQVWVFSQTARQPVTEDAAEAIARARVAS